MREGVCRRCRARSGAKGAQHNYRSAPCECGRCGCAQCIIQNVKQTPFDLPEAINELHACWEAFRRIGFPADFLFVGWQMTPHGPEVVSQLQWYGKTFSVAYGVEQSIDQQAFEAAWRARGAEINAGKFREWGIEKYQAFLEESYVFTMSFDFVRGILLKGIPCPSAEMFTARARA